MEDSVRFTGYSEFESQEIQRLDMDHPLFKLAMEFLSKDIGIFKQRYWKCCFK